MSDGVSGGSLVDGRFRLVKPLGQGHAGQVWQAVDEQGGRRVAIKLYRARPGLDPAVSVPHPCVVSILSRGTHEGAPYMVMELVDGVSLATVLEDGPVPDDDARVIAAGVCDALRVAHFAGVTHGNLKPSNVLIALGEGGHPVIKVGDFIGRGGPREDMYSLGLLMEAMSGRTPIVEQLLSREPYSPAQLRSILSGFTASAEVQDEPDPDRPSLRRLAVIGGVVVVAAVVAACAWLVQPIAPPDILATTPSGGRSLSAAETVVEASGGARSAGPLAAVVTSKPPPPPVPPSPPPSVIAGNGIEAARSVIAEQLRTGNAQPDAASRLNTRLDGMVKFYERGQTKQVNMRVEAFRSELATMLQSQLVTKAGHDAILAAVNRLVA